MKSNYWLTSQSRSLTGQPDTVKLLGYYELMFIINGLVNHENCPLNFDVESWLRTLNSLC